MIMEPIKIIAGFLLWVVLLLFLLALGRSFWKALVELLADVCEEVEKRRKDDG
ncbi:hypothetical protein [Thermococcus barophilus]|uniref:Uncharacterized protein n=1 Tax=Thermococcus barophilus (strain DSM 11836 / MP) TaxID=391623 RepID=F0LN69_THEBM|nr:hypothetical protein [Thermococcus barophilus]ADT85208.1 hypothetical protein TERMP_02235 [Thermococcus barophilus MP]